MRILTAQHTRPGRTVTVNGQVYPTQLLIDREDWAKLAQGGAYRHVTAEGPAPLGYTDWVLTGDTYTREPAGTQAERDAAALQRTREGMTITRLQARLLLLQTPDPSATFASAWEAVLAWATTQDANVLAFFEDAQNWKRLDPNVIAGATAFGWDDATLDNLFAAGAQL